jgi:demethylmenaquinone methyltransferase/2-methoxy-6-polyprenyl-1,4-benzoquinol methylase
MTQKYQAEKVMPYADGASKTSQVERMFDSIAHTYDSLNITLSFGIDRLWRRRALRTLAQRKPQQVLDVATGTGDFAILAARKLRPQRVLGIDLSEGMLAVGRKKVAREGLTDVIELEAQDCLNLGLADDSFDAVTVAFGVRNFEDIERGYREMHRVLRPGGTLLVLELSTPEHFPMKQLYGFYSSTVIPLVGRLFSRDRSAYDYLNRSVRAVPQGEGMAAIFRKAGFRDVSFKRYTCGICTCYVGVK